MGIDRVFGGRFSLALPEFRESRMTSVEGFDASDQNKKFCRSMCLSRYQKQSKTVDQWRLQRSTNSRAVSRHDLSHQLAIRRTNKCFPEVPTNRCIGFPTVRLIGLPYSKDFNAVCVFYFFGGPPWPGGADLARFALLT